jgi:glycosyltransferase involved in cell wall biosynthesis
MRAAAIIPAFNEEAAIHAVVAGVRRHIPVVIVVDGGSPDATAARARAAGATVIIEAQRGYGRAIRAGIEAAPNDADILLFVDGDGSDRVDLIPELLAPLIEGGADFVHGTRLRGDVEPGALSLPQRVAGRLAGLLIGMLYGVRYTDMSPFRALRRDTLHRLGMREATFGWNLEMQMRVAAGGLRVVEVPVGQRRRQGGASKVSGDAWTALRVAFVLGGTFLRLASTLRREKQA